MSTYDNKKNRFVKGKRQGFWEYYRDGKIISRGNYVDGVLDGHWEVYFNNSQLCCKVNYKKGIYDGLHEYYNTEGILTESKFYVNI